MTKGSTYVQISDFVSTKTKNQKLPYQKTFRLSLIFPCERRTT